jgi:hypothetical protein
MSIRDVTVLVVRYNYLIYSGGGVITLRKIVGEGVFRPKCA